MDVNGSLAASEIVQKCGHVVVCLCAYENGFIISPNHFPFFSISFYSTRKLNTHIYSIQLEMKRNERMEIDIFIEIVFLFLQQFF